MKKLMIALAAVALAVSAQAAQATWYTSGTSAAKILGSDGSAMGTDTYAYLLLATDVSDFTKALTTKTTASTVDDSYLSVYSGGYNAKGTMNLKPVADNDAITTSEQSYQIVLVEFDGTGDTATHYSVGASKSLAGSADVGTTPVNWVWGGSNMGTWQTIKDEEGGGGIPEPTSGLLMVVGLAGLALRRRRA